MVLVDDPSLSDICRRLNEHRRCSAWLRTRCAAGCGRWPCGVFLRALEEMLRSSWLSRQTGGCGADCAAVASAQSDVADLYQVAIGSGALDRHGRGPAGEHQ